MTATEHVDDLAAAMAELATVLVDEADLAGMLDRVVRLAARSIADCDSAGITLMRDEQPVTAAASDDRTLVVDQRQYRAGDGPCLEAYRTSSVQRVVVDEAALRYPEFAAGAREAGIRSFLAAPLVVRAEAIGSINLYSADSHGFAALDEAVVVLFAAQAAVAVSNSRMYQSAHLLSLQLEAAMSSRATIEQAKGVLMAVKAVDADEAFALLRRTSQVENRKLRDIAADIVETASAGRRVELRG